MYDIPRVVALHSSGASGRQWAALAAHLTDVEFVAPDLCGHGSAPAWLGMPGDIFRADIERVAAIALGDHRRCHLVGHSYGGAVAIGLALTRPAQVASVTVYEPVLFGTLGEASSSWQSIRDLAQNIERSLGDGEPEAAAQAFVEFWSGPQTWIQMPRSRRTSVASCMFAIAAHFIALRAWRVGARELEALRAPLLHLAGDQSPAVMRDIEHVLRRALPNARFRVLSAMGHMGPVTCRDTVAWSIEQHLRTLMTMAPGEPHRRAA